jgi:hypothetical protein
MQPDEWLESCSVCARLKKQKRFISCIDLISQKANLPFSSTPWRTCLPAMQSSHGFVQREFFEDFSFSQVFHPVQMEPGSQVSCESCGAVWNLVGLLFDFSSPFLNRLFIIFQGSLVKSCFRVQTEPKCTSNPELFILGMMSGPRSVLVHFRVFVKFLQGHHSENVGYGTFNCFRVRKKATFSMFCFRSCNFRHDSVFRHIDGQRTLLAIQCRIVVMRFSANTMICFFVKTNVLFVCPIFLATVMICFVKTNALLKLFNLVFCSSNSPSQQREANALF